jgi:hypothetical protein
VKPARLQGLRPLRTLPRALLAVLALPLFGAPAAAQVQLAPARDAMMFEDSGSLGNGGGYFFIVGRTGGMNSFYKKRSLIAFDIASRLPAGATVTSASLSLYMRKTVSGPQTVRMHRAARAWGEGSSYATGGNGVQATPGDVTWTDTFYPGQKWSQPGGDFLAQLSASQVVDDLGWYTWSSAQLTADVQAMLDNPQNDFGWILIGNETGQKTTKMFGSRTGFSHEVPYLTVSYTVPLQSYCTSGTSASGCQATVSASGTPSATAPAGFVLSATGVEGLKDGLFFFGTAGRQANAWGNSSSYQCVVPPVARGGLLPSAGTVGACDGGFDQDLNARWTARPAQNPGPGAVVQAQLWYRDPQSTSNQTTTLTNALEVDVCP